MTKVEIYKGTCNLLSFLSLGNMVFGYNSLGPLVIHFIANVDLGLYFSGKGGGE